MAVWNTGPTPMRIPYWVYSVIDDTFVTQTHVETEWDDLPFITFIRIVSSQLDLVSFLLLLSAVYGACEKWQGVWIIYKD